MESLDRSLESANAKIPGMIEGVNHSRRCILLSYRRSLRTIQHFETIIVKCNDMNDEFNLEGLLIPRVRKIPKKISDSGSTNFIS